MYTTQSVKLAYRMSKTALVAAIAPHYANPKSQLAKWSKDELANAWLEHFGEKDMPETFPCVVCGKPHNRFEGAVLREPFCERHGPNGIEDRIESLKYYFANRNK